MRKRRARAHWLRALDLFAPQRCLECSTLLPDTAHRQSALARRVERGIERVDSPLCRRCDLALAWWRHADGCPRCGHRPSGPAARSDEACPRCLANGSPLHTSLALLRYEGPIRRWLPAFKNPSNLLGPTAAIDRVVDYLAAQLAFRFARRDAEPLDALVAIPLHCDRLRRRGFNQSEIIAVRVARRLSIPVHSAALLRTRATRAQAGLRGRARRENLRGAFQSTHRFPSHARIGLVDDVLTTGSTLEAAAECVLDAGALEVHALTLASTLPGGRAAAARRRGSQKKRPRESERE